MLFYLSDLVFVEKVSGLIIDIEDIVLNPNLVNNGV